MFFQELHDDRRRHIIWEIRRHHNFITILKLLFNDRFDVCFQHILMNDRYIVIRRQRIIENGQQALINFKRDDLFARLASCSVSAPIPPISMTPVRSVISAWSTILSNIFVSIKKFCPRLFLKEKPYFSEFPSF